MLNNIMKRLKIIYNCLYHGLLPYYFYEKECHYECSYLEHLIINLKYAYRWLSFNETGDDIEFEKENN